ACGRRELMRLVVDVRNVDVVAPCGDLVSGDLEHAHGRSLAWLSPGAPMVDALGEDDIAGDRQIDNLSLKLGDVFEEALDRLPDRFGSRVRGECESGPPRRVRGEVGHDLVDVVARPR